MAEDGGGFPILKLIEYVILFFVLVIVVYFLGSWFYNGVIPFFSQWGPSKVPPTLIGDADMQTVRDALNYYTNLPGGYVFLKICTNTKVGACDVELAFDKDKGGWNIRPYTEVKDSKLDSVVRFMNVDTPELTDTTMKKRTPLDFFTDWNRVQAKYSKLVESLRGTDEYRTGVLRIVKFIRESGNTGMDLEIWRRYSGAGEYKEFEGEAVELKLNVLVSNEDIQESNVGKIVEFTSDYYEFSRFHSSMDYSYKSAPERLDLLFIPSLTEAMKSDKKKNYILQPVQASKTAPFWGVVVYDRVTGGTDEAQWLVSLIERENNRNWRRYIFVKSDLGDGFFTARSDPTGDGISDELKSWPGQDTVAVKGKVGNYFGENTYLLNAIIIGSVESNLGKKSRGAQIYVRGSVGDGVGEGMRTGIITVTGKAGSGIGRKMIGSTLIFTDFDDKSKLAKIDQNGGNEFGNVDIPTNSLVLMKGKKVWPQKVPWDDAGWVSPRFHFNMQYNNWNDGSVDFMFYKGSWNSKRAKFDSTKWCVLSTEFGKENAPNQGLDSKEKAATQNFPGKAGFEEGVNYIFKQFVELEGYELTLYYFDTDGKEVDTTYHYSSIQKTSGEERDSLIRAYQSRVLSIAYNYDQTPAKNKYGKIGMTCKTS